MILRATLAPILALLIVSANPLTTRAQTPAASPAPQQQPSPEMIEIAKYMNTAIPAIMTLPGIFDSMSQASEGIAGLEQEKCTALVTLYRDFLQGLLTYMKGITAPASLQSAHKKLISAQVNYVSGLNHFRKYCSNRNGEEIDAATDFINESIRLTNSANQR